jgi:hypothetical protein
VESWRGLPRWARWVIATLAVLVLLYVFGYIVFGCGTDTAGSPYE